MKTKFTKCLAATLVAILFIVAAPHIALATTISISGSGPFNVPAGTTATITGDITGTITVNGGTLILNANHEINGTVNVNSGSFYMSSGTITGAGTRGVTITGHTSKFEMSGGIITGNTFARGAGVYAQRGASFYMLAGSGPAPKIINNHSPTDGGGVMLAYDEQHYTGDGTRTTFVMEAGIIYGNTASMPTPEGGGGVRVIGASTFIMRGGTIDNNTASHGGGVSIAQANHLINNHPTFYMYGGYIINNSATSHGGGIRSGINSTVHIHGGTIRGNTAQGDGGGAFVSGTNISFKGVLKNSPSDCQKMI